MPGREELWLDDLSDPISHYTHGVRVGDLVFVSGCIGSDEHGNIVGGEDVAAQARQALLNIEKVLKRAGSSLAHVCKVTVYLTDVDDRTKINPVRRELFGTARPASTLIEISRLAHPEAKVEIEAIAVVSRGS
jgi:2-iminobutanoate/2-iminopropanoate deaminase